MFTKFDITPCFFFTVLLASNMVQPSKTQACQPPPCQNGGTCFGNNICQCPPGLTGPTCTNVDCDNYPCLNGGTCIRDSCKCPDGFVLPFCTTSCTSCFNGGTCSNGVCSCDSGYVGPTCEKAIFAYLNPVAVTVNEGNNDHDVMIQVCRQPDNSAITLRVYTSSRSASSSSDFENIPSSQDVIIPFGQVCTTETVTIKGDHMFEQTEEFSLVLLIPGMVQQIVYTLPGNTRTTITIMNDDPVNCDLDRPCFNGGTCRPSVSQNPCTCPDGFVEPFCTTSCRTDPCRNGGTCNDDVCSCQPGSAGPICQNAVAVYLSPLEVSVTEGNTGFNNVRIHLCRQQSDQAATVTVTTSQVTAIGTSDFAYINKAVTIPFGQVCAPVDISIVSDMIIEPTEVFHVVILSIQLPTSVYIVPAQGTATVTIIDNDDTEHPVITNCPFVRSVSITPGTSTTSVFWAPPTASDNFGDVTLSSSHQVGDTFPLGQTTVTYIAMDGAGNTEQCQFVITVMIDIDECSIGSHICDAMTSECMNNIGSYRCDCRTGYTGESYSPGQQPTCEETELPIIFNCPDDITVTAPAGAAATVVYWTPPVAFDTSGTVTLTSSQNPGDFFSIGSTEVIYTAIDGADNMASDCKFTVTVVELPSIRDPPTELTRTTTSVTIAWRPWDEETDVGDPPVVAYIPYYKMNPSQDWMNGSRIQADQTLQYTVSSLESDRNYTFSIAAVREGEGGEGPRGPAVTIKTLCIDVVPQMVTTTLIVTNDVTVTWQKPTVQCSTGITQFTIYYEIEGDVTSRQEAGTADPNAESFTVDGSLLEPGMTYNIAVTVTTDQESALSEGRTVTATKPTGSSGSSVAIIIIIGVVIVVLIVLILLFLIVIVVRKRKMEDQPDPIDNQPLNDIGNRSGPSGNTYHSPGAVNTALNVTEANKTKERSAANSSVLDVGGIYGNLEPPSPIRIAEFPEYIISNIDKVEHEFGLLEGVQQKHPWTVAEEEYNRKKNRFRNMYPYDHCRVVLPKLPGDHHSDYYNASFILNERDVRAYIASQAPNKASVDDFWRLIWEQNVQTIVMLANLYEDTKERCLQYWPKEENETQCFGYINVTWTKTQHFADYVIRTLSVERGGTIREVKQLHFKEWPDKDVPDSAMCLVEFARHCKLIHFKKQTPLLIHCSAGIGRTGTFIGLLSMMDVLQSKEYIDIFAFVNKMRENRVNMIQTKKQYRYLHTCLYEFHLTRDCQISAQILSRFKIHDNKAAILREFELLSEVEMSKTNDSPKTGGTTDSLARGNSTDSLETGGSMKTEHAPRDRFGNMVPTGGRKVFMLSSSPSNPDNYINASFVKSYEKKDAFITTQSPLPNTIEDFWRMIYDHKCRTVVMLNQLDKSDKTCVQYWPDRGSLQYGIMTVTCIATEQQSDYVKRTFDVSLNDSANVISVTHLQLEEWPPNGSPQSVIRLITDAQKLQKEANIEKPLVVHCINGFGRSGVFVTVQSEMERIRATGLVDIFATVKKLRNEHQHMMRKKMDYILCFDFLIEFSKRYGNYENW